VQGQLLHSRSSAEAISNIHWGVSDAFAHWTVRGIRVAFEQQRPDARSDHESVEEIHDEPSKQR
jgi:hypothetical protein